jgi:MFS transporter, DHA1 family, multidrug resistance protein
MEDGRRSISDKSLSRSFTGSRIDLEDKSFDLSHGQNRRSLQGNDAQDLSESESNDAGTELQDVEKQMPNSAESSQNEREKKDPHLIEWDGPDDPGNPMNWKTWKKWLYTICLGFMTFTITFASSVFSTATMVTAKQFGVSSEVMTLGTSLFVLGFAFGPIFFGPLSELYGRKIPLYTGYFIFAIFQIPVAVAQNLQTIMICRFLGGLFGSAPLAIVGGTLADFWDPIDRGIAICIFAGATFVVGTFAPIIADMVFMFILRVPSPVRLLAVSSPCRTWAGAGRST